LGSNRGKSIERGAELDAFTDKDFDVRRAGLARGLFEPEDFGCGRDGKCGILQILRGMTTIAGFDAALVLFDALAVDVLKARREQDAQLVPIVSSLFRHVDARSLNEGANSSSRDSDLRGDVGLPNIALEQQDRNLLDDRIALDVSQSRSRTSSHDLASSLASNKEIKCGWLESANEHALMPDKGRILVSLSALMIRRVRKFARKARSTNSIVVEAALQEVFDSADFPKFIALVKDLSPTRRRRK